MPQKQNLFTAVAIWFADFIPKNAAPMRLQGNRDESHD